MSCFSRGLAVAGLFKLCFSLMMAASGRAFAEAHRNYQLDDRAHGSSEETRKMLRERLADCSARLYEVLHVGAWLLQLDYRYMLFACSSRWRTKTGSESFEIRRNHANPDYSGYDGCTHSFGHRDGFYDFLYREVGNVGRAFTAL